MNTHAQLYADRTAGGRALASKLAHFADASNLLVLALPRGGVPVGYEVAHSLHGSFDVYIVRKLGVPGHEELAMGAITSAGTMVLNDEVVKGLGIPDSTINTVARREQLELARREKLYRGNREFPKIQGRPVILVDDGLATGTTMRAAAETLRQQNPAHLVIAVPVGSADIRDMLKPLVDEVVCALTPEPFYAVGLWYQDFAQVSDEEVRAILQLSLHDPLISHR